MTLDPVLSLVCRSQRHKSLGYLVQGITCRSLLNLTELKLCISDDKLAQPGAEVHDGLKLRCWNVETGTGYLNQCADKRAARPQSDRHADRSFSADGSDFDGGVLGHLHNERDHSTLRKINGIQGTTGLFQQVSLLGSNFAEMLT